MMPAPEEQSDQANAGPADWMAQLGALPDQPDAFPERIRLCQQALKSVRREEQPKQWGYLHAEIGYCSTLLRVGDPADNLQQAIEHYEQALKVYTPEAYFEQWVGASHNLAIAYKQWTGGERAKNLERAIQLQEEILHAHVLSKCSQAWVQAHSELGYLYLQRIEGDKAHNLETAIAHYQHTLEVWQRESAPARWAKVHYNLGTACFRLQRLGKNRTTYQEQAIAHFEQALEVLAQGVSSQEWTEAQHNLALVYLDRQQGDRTQNIRLATELLKAVSRVCRCKGLLVEWAMAQNALGMACLESIQGGRSENMERAIGYFRQALAEQERVGPVGQTALTQHNLSAAYTDRLLGDRTENLREAVEYDRAALATISQCKYAQSDWATIKTGLAGALWRLATHFGQQGQHEPAAASLEEAIQHGEEVVSGLEAQSFSYQRAFACYNLANIYSDRIRGDRSENQKQAIKYYEQALEFYTPGNFPNRWANAHGDLGVTYLERRWAKRADNVKKAVEHFNQALEIFKPATFPASTLRVARNLGNLHFEERHWKKAIAPYCRAMGAAEHLYQASLLRSGKEAELGQVAGLYPRAAYALARDGDLKEAVVTLEHGRARLLSEALQRDYADLEALKDTHPDLYRRYYQTASEIADLMHQELRARTPYPTVDLTAAMQDTRHKLDQTVADIQHISGYENFLALPKFEDVIQAVQPDMPLVYIANTPVGGLALIVHPDSIKRVWLDNLNTETLSAQVRRWFEVYSAHLEARRAYGETRRETDLLEIPEEEKKTRLELLRSAVVSTQQAWHDTLEHTTRWLWDALMGPVVHALQKDGYIQATLIPTGWLAFLPLHAAWTEDNMTITGRRYAMDVVAFSYIPAARALVHARSIATATQGDRLFAVGNPDGSLRYSTHEVLAVARHFLQPWVVHRERATRNTTLHALPQCNVYHFSCHGSNDWREPLESALRMYGQIHQVRLTVGNLLTLERKLQARLAFLSACETGLIGADLPDEVVGLASGFLQAGTAGVVSTLWSVEDESTALLAERFYHNWKKQRMEPPQALGSAQQWLRDEAGGGRWSHPYYWAGFTLTGV